MTCLGGFSTANIKTTASIIQVHFYHSIGKIFTKKTSSEPGASD